MIFARLFLKSAAQQMSFVLIRLTAYTTVLYSKALEEYEQNPSKTNHWTCYLLSLIAPPDTIKIDLQENSSDKEYSIVRYDGKEITIHMPMGYGGPYRSPMEARSHLEKYIVPNPIHLEVSLDEEYITNLLKDLDDELKDLDDELKSYDINNGGTIFRMCLEAVRQIALAIEPILLQKKWKREWTSCQKKYDKIIGERRYLSINSGGGLVYKIWDRCNDFNFEMSSTFAEHNKWFPNCIVKTVKEPQFI